MNLATDAFRKVFDLDQEKLSENPKVTSKKRYAEYELHKIYPSYMKSNYKAEEFVGNIDTAIKMKEFCEDIEGLKHSIGSNIGLLIEDTWGNSSILDKCITWAFLVFITNSFLSNTFAIYHIF